MNIQEAQTICLKEITILAHYISWLFKLKTFHAHRHDNVLYLRNDPHVL